jgi:hypothetical protein
MIVRAGIRDRIVGRPPNVRLLTLFLGLVLALQWATTTGGTPGARYTQIDPAGTARLEPTTPAQPFLVPREDTRGVIGQQQTQPTEKAASPDKAAGWTAAPAAPVPARAVAPSPYHWSLSPRALVRAYDPRGPPLPA